MTNILEDGVKGFTHAEWQEHKAERNFSLTSLEAGWLADKLQRIERGEDFSDDPPWSPTSRKAWQIINAISTEIICSMDKNCHLRKEAGEFFAKLEQAVIFDINELGDS